VIIDEVISKHNEVARVFWRTKIAKVDTEGRIRKIEKSLSLPWGVFLRKLASFCGLCEDIKEIKSKVKIRALRLLLGTLHPPTLLLFFFFFGFHLLIISYLTFVLFVLYSFIAIFGVGH
jgi:ABC-type bacteriocin/lantibiotic exporter with double-glycine peptidase domain